MVLKMSTLLVLLLAVPANAFTLTTLRSVGAFRTPTAAPSIAHAPLRQQPGNERAGVSSLKAIGVTSTVIETVAKGVLNLALANPKQATVECRINSSARNLVRGYLEQAKVDG